MTEKFSTAGVRTACVLILASFSLRAEDVRLADVQRLPGGKIQLTLEGKAAAPVTLQSSTDLRNWNDVETFTLEGTPISYVDEQAGSVAKRSYRLHVSTPAISTLPDLGELQNRVFPAPEGFNTVQYAPDGRLGFIVWRDTDLLFRERAVDGTWREQVVASGGNAFKPYLTFEFTAPREDYRFQPAAVLLYDSGSQPHIFKAEGRTVAHYTFSGSWNLAETIADHAANADIAALEGAIGPDNTFHLAALSVGSPRNLTYGTARGGQWNWRDLSTVTDPPLTYWAPPFAARWLALAVDSHNAAHIAFRSALNLTYDSASHPRAYSELKYASNASGQWVTTLVSKPRDQSGEAANGASIAIGPDDKPRIVSWYDERGDGGSAEESRLYFHQQYGDGSWNASIVASQADGYVAADGNKGTGFSPYLRYDAKGGAHILFLDHAGEHFGGIGQQEYAGSVRHAWWNGNAWSTETVFRQSAPLQQEAVYPAFAVSSSEMAITVLQRDTQWNYSSYPPLSPSKYYFRFFTKPLP